ncbi:MAG: hypothetical protein ACREVE_17110 [Gammaproteobacteria bacterium]
MRNLYDGQGFLKRVEKADEPSLIHWRLDKVNAAGQITDETGDQKITVAHTATRGLGPHRHDRGGLVQVPAAGDGQRCYPDHVLHRRPVQEGHRRQLRRRRRLTH